MKSQFFNSGYVDSVIGIDHKRGFSCVPVRQEYRGFLYPRKAIYQFKLYLNHPLTFYSAAMLYYIQPDRLFESDQGSVPLWFQKFLPKDRYLGFLPHDSAHVHGGLWLSHSGGEGTYQFVALPKQTADELLKEMVLADPYPASKFMAQLIYDAVVVGGRNYGKGDLRKKVSA